MDTVVDGLRKLLASYTEPCAGNCEHSQCPLLRELHALAISNVLEQARQTVKPVVDVERKGEEIGDLMNMRLRAPSPVAVTVDAEKSSRHPHYTHADDARLQELLDALPEIPSEEEAEAVLQAAGTSGKEVVNGFIEKLLRENLELKTKLSTARHYSCSCGGALTAEEYIEHYFEKGHDRGEPSAAFKAAAAEIGERAAVGEQLSDAAVERKAVLELIERFQREPQRSQATINALEWLRRQIAEGNHVYHKFTPPTVGFLKPEECTRCGMPGNALMHLLAAATPTSKQT